MCMKSSSRSPNLELTHKIQIFQIHSYRKKITYILLDTIHKFTASLSPLTKKKTKGKLKLKVLSSFLKLKRKGFFIFKKPRSQESRNTRALIKSMVSLSVLTTKG